MCDESNALIMEAVNASEISVNIYQNTRFKNLDGSHLYTRRCEDLEPKSVFFVFLSWHLGKNWCRTFLSEHLVLSQETSASLVIRVRKVKNRNLRESTLDPNRNQSFVGFGTVTISILICISFTLILHQTLNWRRRKILTFSVLWRN